MDYTLEISLLNKLSREKLIDLIIRERNQSQKSLSRQIEVTRLLVDGINNLTQTANRNFNSNLNEYTPRISETFNHTLAEMIDMEVRGR